MQHTRRYIIPALVAAAAFLAANSAMAREYGHERHDLGTTHGQASIHTDHATHRDHGDHGRGHGEEYYRSSRDCFKVSKHGYYHGREARIGGTMCYDRYGDPYIVQGSRYVIHYY